MLTTLMGLVRKEFIQIFRDHNMLCLIFAVPIIQLILFGYVVNTEVKQLNLDVYDYDRSQLSREFVKSTSVGDYFSPVSSDRSVLSLEKRFEGGTSELAVIIPNNFSEKLKQREKVTIGLIADGTNANATAIGLGYMGQIAREFSQKVTVTKPPVDIKYRFLYNPEMESVYFMVPGIVAALLTMVTTMLTSMAIVRERERGTLEQLLVTPISTSTLLLGKVIPFAVLGLFEMTLALTVGVLWFGVPFIGSPVLLLILSLLYLLTTLGVGLFFSTVTSTQQQAMFFAWFFSIFVLLTSGFFTPISTMPEWMQYITYANPMRYFVAIARGIMMKGSGLGDLFHNIYPMAIFGVTIFSFAAIRFTKRVA
ncbi:MAG: ABC transporter permease [candidate division Zixibacteria bacterium]|nr:ABC transporter permease [candidate division Zixibacteria bacterium]